MKRILLFALVGATLASCNKDDNNTPAPNPTPTSVEARYQISFDTAKFQADSLLVSYLSKDGKLVSGKVTTSSWESPAMTFKNNDTAYAQVIFFGKKKSPIVQPAAIQLTKTSNGGILLIESSGLGTGTDQSFRYQITMAARVTLK